MTLSRTVTIVSTGHAVPSRCIDTATLRRLMPEAPMVAPESGAVEWTRYWCAAHESTADLAEEAAQQALERAGLSAANVDLLVVATDTPEFVQPATAAVLQGRLDMRSVPAFDLASAGDGFLPALEVVRGYLAGAPTMRRALLVGASTLSKYLDVHDVRTAPHIGDGAGAMLLEVDQSQSPGASGTQPGVLGCDVRTSARDVHAFGIFAGGSRMPVTHAVIDAGIQNRLRWTGPMPPQLAIDACVDQIRTLLIAMRLTPAMVQRWLWAQIADGSIAALMAALHVDPARACSTVARYGYTGAACTPLTLDHAVSQGDVVDGDLVVLAGAGAGRDLCVTVLRWGRG
jgi:3-oxoacyl-[acyl-carrier-protein] synthase-3